MHYREKIDTLVALGIGNIAQVGWYRSRLRLRCHPVQRISANVSAGPFFRMPATARLTGLPVNRQWHRQQSFFGWFTIQSPSCPDWFTNPFNGKRLLATNQPWWTIPDFSSEIGDIKTVWDASRFDWVLGFAQQASQGDTVALEKLNAWLADWSSRNQPYLGPNWKCGQEASIRVMHVAMAALILEQADSPEPALTRLITMHLQRIAPTISYAMAQDNNHGTSEAAALFIGGNWLARLGEKRGKTWAKAGRKWLENRARHLIEPDGSFSQYSVNYHRVMLDTYCMAEIWRRRSSLPEFSPMLCERLGQAAMWLHHFTHPDTGDTPNLGANDGARLLPLTDTDYRDYRPTVQLGMALFGNCRVYEREGAWNLPLNWLDVPLPRAPAKPTASRHFMEGGYCIMQNNASRVFLRYPRFRFRPGHADALHIDLWRDSENILRDGGSFSYADSDTMRYFTGVSSHNTIQFDDHDQMPRLGRFLFGEWLRTSQIDPIKEQKGVLSTGVSYRDWQGACHDRKIALSDGELRITDEISGFRKKAVLRWRLAPGNWEINDNSVTRGRVRMKVTGSMEMSRMELTEGRESRYYLQQTPLPVLEVEVNAPGTLVTVVEFEAR